MNLQSALSRDSDWQPILASEFQAPYMHSLETFLQQEEDAGKIVHPLPAQRLHALNTTPYAHVKVVILGQDPYPSPGHAHGLSFSVLPEVSPLPKSLQNIYRELADDLGIANRTGFLQPWAEQGVLLLNAVLSVAEGNAGSHRGKGWEMLTDRIVEALNAHPAPLVFLLWGAYAQKKGRIIDRSRHAVIESPHPSPLSAYRGFFGSKPFSRTNAYLAAFEREPIDWQL